MSPPFWCTISAIYRKFDFSCTWQIYFLLRYLASSDIPNSIAVLGPGNKITARDSSWTIRRESLTWNNCSSVKAMLPGLMGLQADLSVQGPVIHYSAISWINLYPVDNTVDFVTASPQHSNLSGPVVQNERRITLYIYWINLYPQDNTIGFLNTYPLNSDLSDI